MDSQTRIQIGIYFVHMLDLNQKSIPRVADNDRAWSEFKKKKNSRQQICNNFVKAAACKSASISSKIGSTATSYGKIQIKVLWKKQFKAIRRDICHKHHKQRLCKIFTTRVKFQFVNVLLVQFR